MTNVLLNLPEALYMQIVTEPEFTGWAFRGPLSLAVAW